VIAWAAAAALLALAHPPAWAPYPAAAEPFPSAGAAVESFVGGLARERAAGVVAFGELHQTARTAGVRSTLSRFTDDVLPAVAPRAAHLIVETWVSRGTCGAAEKRVTEDVARATERPPATEDEIVRLLRRAKELGVAPHVLDVDCHEYQALQAGGRVDYDRLLKLTRAHLQRAIEQALALPRPAGRPLILVYGGALHNDLAPAPALAAYSFGPAIDQATGGRYREVDLYVPALVEALPALRAEPWYPIWRAARAPGATLLIRRGPRSAIVLFPAGGQR
jgi:hypothetical protein